MALAHKIVGVGGAGVNVVEHLIATGLGGLTFAVVNTDGQSLGASSASEKVHLETKLLRGLGTGGDPERGRAMAEEQMPRLKVLCEGVRVMFIVTGLGGGAGTGIAPVLARAAKEAGALTLAFVVLPFECEGGLRTQAARAGLDRIRRRGHGLVCRTKKPWRCFADGATSRTPSRRQSIPRQLCPRRLPVAGQPNADGLPFADLRLLRQRSSHWICSGRSRGLNRASESSSACSLIRC
jgi:cell division protein FtsZ